MTLIKGRGNNTKTNEVEATAKKIKVTRCGTTRTRIVVPGPAAPHNIILQGKGFFQSRTAIGGGTLVIIVPFVLTPFPNIAMHVV